MSLSTIERAGLLSAAGVAVGVHAALAPEHLREWAPLGTSFVLASVAVSAAVAAFAVAPAGVLPARALALLLAGLVFAYVATRLAELPPLDPEREPFDRLGVATTAVEAVGLLFALHLSRLRGGNA